MTLRTIFRKIISAAVLTAIVAIPAKAQNSYFMHTVTQGQGLYSISRMYGVTEDDIIRLNPGSETVIHTGQQLRIPSSQKSGNSHFHTIQKGETLYRLSVENRISVKELCDANPGLSADNFKVGQVITIPAVSDEDPLASTLEQAGESMPQQTAQDMAMLASDTAKYKGTHVVQKRETVFRICRNYGITQQEFLDANPEYRYMKLRQGVTVNIPFSGSELAQRSQKHSEAVTRIESIPDSTLFRMNSIVEQDHDGVITAALLLPFALDDSATTDQKRMVEFYQGILLALDKLKNENVSVDLKLFDTKAEGNSIQPLLDSGELDNVDIVFGPRWSDQIAEAAQWSTEHHIPLVLPMNSSSDEVFTHPYIYQLNTPQSYQYQEIYSHFLKQFPNPNVILLDAEEYKRNEFIDGLKHVMNDHSIPYTTVLVDTAAQSIMDAIMPEKQNVFIINSNASGPLNTMLPVLQLIARTKSPDVETHLFGYPEYQIYASSHLDEMYEVDTWFYSWFYTNNLLEESIDFGNRFRHAFSRQMMLSYPSFASYGYDTGYYFLKGLATFGKNFEDHLSEIQSDPVQMGFKFERVNNWGGFINRKVFLVHFSNNFKVERIDFDK